MTPFPKEGGREKRGILEGRVMPSFKFMFFKHLLASIWLRTRYYLEKKPLLVVYEIIFEISTPEAL